MSASQRVGEESAAFIAAEPFAREHLFTVEDLIRLGADGYLPELGRTELVDGRIEIMPADGDLHVYTLKRLTDFFYATILADSALKDVVSVYVKATLVLGLRNSREPDFMITGVVPHDRLPAPADVKLLVEASVTSQTRDLETKRRAYAAAGIADYWVWDAEARKLVIFRKPEADDYAEKTTLTEGTASPLFAPQITLPLTALIPA